MFEDKLNRVISSVFKLSDEHSKEAGAWAPPPEFKVPEVQEFFKINKQLKPTHTFQQIKSEVGGFKLGNETFSIGQAPGQGGDNLIVYSDTSHSYWQVPANMTIKQFLENIGSK